MNIRDGRQLSPGDIAALLAGRAADVAKLLLPSGKIMSGAWRCASTDGDPGQSMILHVRGDRCGRWHDFATGESGDLLDLFGHVHGVGVAEAMREAADYLGISLGNGQEPRRRQPAQGDRAGSTTRPERKPAPALPADNDPTKLERASAIWREAGPIRGSVTERYLLGRGCMVPPADGDLRFVPRLALFGFEAPAMIGLITNALDYRITLGLHITWLKPDGSGRGERRYLGRKGGGVVRLWPDEEVEMGLAVAEGIETASAAAHAFQPIWACLDAGNLAAFPVLAGIECLTVFADHDAKGAGQAAAWKCRNRWLDAGVRARVILPDAVGDDVADEVTRCAE